MRVKSSDDFISSAVSWYSDGEYDVVYVNDEVLSSDYETWSSTTRAIGSKLIRASVKPHASFYSFIRIGGPLYRQANNVQVHERHLAEVMRPFIESSGITGLKLGKLSQGNTRVVMMLRADGMTREELQTRLQGWCSKARDLRRLGSSPGQTYGEIAVGMMSLGLLGFRVRQPFEVYPIFVFSDSGSFNQAVPLLQESIVEHRPRRSDPVRLVLPDAPVFVQAIFCDTSSGRVEWRKNGKETHRYWRHYKKPKLAHRIFGPSALAAIIGRSG